MKKNDLMNELNLSADKAKELFKASGCNPEAEEFDDTQLAVIRAIATFVSEGKAKTYSEAAKQLQKAGNALAKQDIDAGLALLEIPEQTKTTLEEAAEPLADAAVGNPTEVMAKAAVFYAQSLERMAVNLVAEAAQKRIKVDPNEAVALFHKLRGSK